MTSCMNQPGRCLNATDQRLVCISLVTSSSSFSHSMSMSGQLFESYSGALCFSLNCQLTLLKIYSLSLYMFLYSSTVPKKS